MDSVITNVLRTSVSISKILQEMITDKSLGVTILVSKRLMEKIKLY